MRSTTSTRSEPRAAELSKGYPHKLMAMRTLRESSIKRIYKLIYKYINNTFENRSMSQNYDLDIVHICRRLNDNDIFVTVLYIAS